MSDVMLSLAEVVRRTGLPRTTLYRRRLAGAFPKTVPMPTRVSVWRARDVHAWIKTNAPHRAALNLL
jgi:predicted DNA-binding transcriptional regulator AlpA